MNPLLVFAIVNKIAEIVTKKKEPVIMKSYILNRLAEASTWRGLFALITATGLAISPDQQTAIMTFGMAAIGMVGTLFPDLKK